MVVMIEIRQTRFITKIIWERMPTELFIQMMRNHIQIYRTIDDGDTELLTYVASDIIKWCDKNGSGLFHFSDDGDGWFEEEADMVAFKLKWHGEFNDEE